MCMCVHTCRRMCFSDLDPKQASLPAPHPPFFCFIHLLPFSVLNPCKSVPTASFQDHLQSHLLQEAFLVCAPPPSQTTLLLSPRGSSLFARGRGFQSTLRQEMAERPARERLERLGLPRENHFRFLRLNEAWRHADGKIPTAFCR